MNNYYSLEVKKNQTYIIDLDFDVIKRPINSGHLQSYLTENAQVSKCPYENVHEPYARF